MSDGMIATYLIAKQAQHLISAAPPGKIKVTQVEAVPTESQLGNKKIDLMFKKINEKDRELLERERDVPSDHEASGVDLVSDDTGSNSDGESGSSSDSDSVSVPTPRRTRQTVTVARGSQTRNPGTSSSAASATTVTSSTTATSSAGAPLRRSGRARHVDPRVAAFLAVERGELASNSIRSTISIAEALELCEEGVEESELDLAVVALRMRDNAREAEEGLDKDGSGDDDEEGEVDESDDED
jgi:hypothetical protein